MTEQFPAHLAAAIRERIAVLRQAWDLDEGIATAPPRVRGYPMSHPRSNQPRPSTT
jgi:hypothetical protein